MTTHPTCRAADAGMVEIVARALHEASDSPLGWEHADQPYWRDQARAAIAAYEAALAASGCVIVPREPTDAMWDAGHAALEIHGESARASCWAFVAMIAAALAQSAPPAKEETSP